MKRVLLLLVACTLIAGFAWQGFAQPAGMFRITFTGRDSATGASVSLDSVWVRNLSAMSDTTLFAPFMLDILLTGINDAREAMPGALEIFANFSNPFADDMHFRVSCARPGSLTVGLYALNGAHVAWLQQSVTNGSHDFILHGGALSVGAYILSVNDGRISRSARVVKSGTRDGGAATISYGGRSAAVARQSLSKTGDAWRYRFTGFSTGCTPASAEASPIADTTVRFEFARIPRSPGIDSLAADAYAVGTGIPVQYDIRSSDPDADLARVLIDYEDDGVFDDSTSISGDAATTRFTTVFASSGGYRARARVVDGRGLIGERTLADPVVVTKANTAPLIVSFVADSYSKATGDTVRYTVATQDADSNLMTVWIDFDGDGTFDDSLSVSGGDDTATFAKVFTAPGNHVARARVMDSLGSIAEKSLTAPVVVTRANTAPAIMTFSADSYVKLTGDTVRYTITAKDPDANLAMVWIDYGSDGVFDDSLAIAGGNTTSTFRVVHATPGAYTAKARVMDAMGLLAERSLPNPVVVTQFIPPPSVTGVQPVHVCIGGDVTIIGAHFGATRGTNTVRFKGGSVASGDDYLVEATDVSSWSDTCIIVHAPDGIIINGVLYVTIGGVASNEFPFQMASIPVLTTSGITNITLQTATGGGVISSDGGCPVTTRGVCWSTDPEPTTANRKTAEGSGVGSFTVNLTGLKASTMYHARAYATNGNGTAYGDEVTFTTGGQVWMTKNLDVSTYRNGDPIPEVTDPAEWENLTTGAWCYYNNDPALGAIYGKLYNWYAVNDPRGLAPAGWHIPEDAEWQVLEMSLGMTWSQADSTNWRGTNEGGKLKEQGTAHWSPPNAGATNSIGFTALPTGHLIPNTGFFGIGQHCYWWTSTLKDATHAWFRCVSSDHPYIWRDPLEFNYGFSVRCVKN